MANQALVSLKRQDNNQPWGFRLKGGADQGIQLFIEHVQPNGRASAAGLRSGDLVLAICGVPTATLTHSQVKGEMLRAGNDLDIVIQRDGDVQNLGQGDDQFGKEEPRSVIDEKPLPKLGGPRFKQVQQKTFQVLEEQLQSDAATTAAAAAEEAVPASEWHEVIEDRPSSIFDRKKDERSDYLKARGNTIQKAFGENPF